MSRSSWIVLVAAVLCGYAAYRYQQTYPPDKPVPAQPAPTKKTPAKKPAPKPRCPNCPSCPNCPNCPSWCEFAAVRPAAEGRPVLGGTDSPDGTVHILFLPPELDWPRNIPSRGLGCCGFRSFDYCARVQNVPEAVNLPEKMRDAGIAGGDYPQKHSQIVAKLCPGITWWQDTGKHIELIAASCASQRPCCVDYDGHDPHYQGTIAHCVTVVACDLESDWVAILDNNFPSLDEIVWMHVDAFQQRWHGWSYGLLAETPGRYNAVLGNAKEPGVNYAALKPLFGGLEKPLAAGDTTVDGTAATIQDILDRIGPEMVPALPAIPVNVDHKIDLDNLRLPLFAAIAGGFACWIITDKKGRN